MTSNTNTLIIGHTRKYASFSAFFNPLYKLLAFVLLLCLFWVGCTEKSQESKKQSDDESFVHNSLTDQEKSDGWILLFNGENTEGWTNYGQDTIGSAWKVDDGTLHLNVREKKDWQAEQGGDIVTKETFENFHLKLEWKISSEGNSGIMFFVQEDLENFRYPWQTGPEMQILDNAGHSDGQIVTHRAGDLYDLIASSEDATKPVGEWNQVAIIVEEDSLTFYMNGIEIVKTSLWDEHWNQLIAESKFKDMNGFGTFRSGKIALQDHGDLVWFRNIKIKRLD